MKRQITVDMGCVHALVFQNESLEDITSGNIRCLVFANVDAYVRKLNEMKKQKHIKILDEGPAVFVED